MMSILGEIQNHLHSYFHVWNREVKVKKNYSHSEGINRYTVATYLR